MKKLFEPVSLNALKLNNRLIRSATWEALGREDGSLPEEIYEIYEELARGGVGAVITGFTSVASNDRFFGGMMRLSDDFLIPQYKRLTDIIHAEDCPVIAQLALGAYYREAGCGQSAGSAHAGPTADPDSPSPDPEPIAPDDMTEDEIRHMVPLFVSAAVRAEAAGFDGVQIHAAHFFFLSRFISPLMNHREDVYGGSAENRGRVLLEIMEGIRRHAPKLHITIKINSSDFRYGGLDEEQCLAICRLLDKAGIDSIEISGNNTSLPGIRPRIDEGYFVPAAMNIASQVCCPVIAVGGFRSRDMMDAVLEKTDIQLISLSRPLLREPDLPAKLQAGLSDVSECVSCNRCYSTPAHKCIFRKKAEK